LSRLAKSTTSIISHTCVTTYAISKWDILKIIPAETVQLFQLHAIVGNIEENKLQEQFYQHLRWERFRSCLVLRVLQERDTRKAAQPANFWDGYRGSHVLKPLGKSAWH
jgi:hypothetical protein